MNIFSNILICLFLFPIIAEANVGLDSISPIQTITGEELHNTPINNRTISDLLKSIPTDNDATFQQQDLHLTQDALRQNLVLLNGRRTTTDLSTIPTAMIDKIEVLKNQDSSIYGSDAIGGVVNIITKKTFELHPQELPSATAFQPIELDWQAKAIPIGRLGLHEEGGQYSYGLSTHYKNEWSWNPSWKLGESYGFSGPIVALGKTPQGPGLSIFNNNGVLIGDVNKPMTAIDPAITSKLLLRAQYPTLYDGYHTSDRIFDRNSFDPYGLMVFPSGRSMGDLFRTGDVLNARLTNFDGYDNYINGMGEEQCTAPYAYEQVYPRTVLDTIPNDPLYQKVSKKRKGGGIPVVSGIVGGLFNVGSGVLGNSTGVSVDKEGPAVYDQYSLPQIGYLPKSDPQSAWNKVDSETKNVIVAVIDSGLYLNHPDGPQYIWTNPKEIPGNAIDDDRNGYIDDVNGWNFLNENNDMKDLRGHGTVVAGIIAARSNNGIGIAGINPGAVIMPLKVADKFGNTNSLNIFRAIKYAVNHGARVINVSLGAKGVSQLERLAINDARSRGVLVVISSGNDGANMSTFGPSSVGNALAVGAMNVDGSRSTVSNWGANNGLMAPGEEIYSLQSKDAPWEGPSGSKERLYTKLSGTSFSTPMVAATAALLLVKNPRLTPDDLEDILVATAKRLGKEDWNGRTGAGFLDAAKAMDAADTRPLNIKVTGLVKRYDKTGKKLEAIDVYATVRGAVKYFTVELGKGAHAGSFKPIIGIAGQQAHDDLVAHITPDKIRGSNEWIVMLKAVDESNSEHQATILLNLK